MVDRSSVEYPVPAMQNVSRIYSKGGRPLGRTFLTILEGFLDQDVGPLEHID